jgi:hypothetical protein
MSKYNLDSLLLETLSAILRHRTELTRLLIALWQHLTKITIYAYHIIFSRLQAAYNLVTKQTKNLVMMKFSFLELQNIFELCKANIRPIPH